MPRGGKRPGAGRPPGALNKRNQEIAARVMAEGISPLEVMLDAMRTAHDAARNPPEDMNVLERIKLREIAVYAAEKAAPYVHPRLASVEAKVDGTLGVYESVPIPVEDRERIPVEGAAGSATGSDS